jgi:hypothetical protein
MRRARRASLSFLVRLISGVRKRLRASCCVIVLAPWTTRPARTFVMVARRIA